MNRSLSTIGAVFATCGVCAVLAGIWALADADNIALLLARYGAFGGGMNGYESAGDWKANWQIASGFYLMAGILLASGGIGVTLASRLGRWLLVSGLILLLLFEAQHVVRTFHGTGREMLSIVGLCGVIALSAWLLFWSSLARAFHGSP